MWKRINLRNRIILILSLLLLIIIVNSSVMVWYTYRLESLFKCLIDKDIAVHRAVYAMETSLANQKGYVSYYLIDGNPEWLNQLEKYHNSFEKYLNKLKKFKCTESDKEAFDQIESEYRRYINGKYQVIALHEAGEKKAADELNMEVRELFFKCLHLCEDYTNIHFEKINSTHIMSIAQAERMRIIAETAMALGVFLSCILAFVLMTQVLGPVRRLALEIDRSDDRKKPSDEIVTLSHQVHDLIKDMEKFSLVGKLAAGMAHSIRNPMTSVKMRLFSLERSLTLSPNQKADFDVISEEMRHISNIIQSFIEFSRPPKLKMQLISPSDVVDNSIKLIHHRLESYNVKVKLERQKRLTETLADPDQMEEVLVNLIINACEAMQDGGSIIISEEEESSGELGNVAVIRVTDEGPGIPESIRQKIFQPFFTCKPEGTGLGLAIAARIVSEHGGLLELQSREGEGATFTINLPLKREKNGQNSYC
ncbi:MCP four helix bundle domain-containing protein [bacterium]|nr:MCP four helix bundle domain-containing protein [bacterium]